MGVKTFGHGDPAIDERLLRLHDRAELENQAMYLDPSSGLWVQTRTTLEKNNKCCGKCCRHCPYSAAEQRAAGRAIVRQNAT